MDWFSWLSKTSLEPSLVYQYGVTFARNELQLEDISYFNHEFLQSMGISIAKHRLEIIKQADREKTRLFRSLARIASAIAKAKRGLLRRVRKLVYYNGDCSPLENGPEMSHLQVEWKKKPIRTRRNNAGEDKEERLMITDWSYGGFSPEDNERIRSPGMYYSGPLDGKLLRNVNRKAVSGPLNFYHPQQHMSHTSRIPMTSRPLVARASSPTPYHTYNKDTAANDGIETFWATLFQNMKPT